MQVGIISIWSKRDEDPHGANVAYTVDVPEGATPEDTLGAAFALTNSDDRPLARNVCSTTVGDLMVLDGVPYFVDGTGFVQLNSREFRAVKNLSCRDTSMGWSWLKTHFSKALGL